MSLTKKPENRMYNQTNLCTHHGCPFCGYYDEYGDVDGYYVDSNGPRKDGIVIAGCSGCGEEWEYESQRRVSFNDNGEDEMEVVFED
jgi:hypothetical protein